MKEGENKRIVKKVNNNSTLNIKVSTQDKDILLKDNEINLKIDSTRGKQQNQILKIKHQSKILI